jgi:16S rRNA G966 N2-methylase RsmD
MVIMDPPYADPAIEQTIASIAESGISTEQGLLVVGHSPRIALADDYGAWQRIKFRRMGDSCFSIYHADV